MQSLYEAVGGHEVLRALAHAWHRRVIEDDVVSHAFSHGFRPDHTERLAAYWAEALGGPPEYTRLLGDESQVIRIHSGNGVHDDMDLRAIACFDAAMTDAGIDDGPLRAALHDYFAWSTSTSMTQYPDSADDVPPGLTVPRWSWDGLVR